MGSKRNAATSTGVLDAAEDGFTEEMETPSRRRPSRVAMTAPHEVADDEEDLGRYDEPAFRRQNKGYRLRLRGGLPKSWVGRLGFLAGLLAIAAVLFAGLAGLRSAFLHDSRFVVTTSSDIQISGNQHVTRADVLSVFGADLERNIFRVPLAERRADLERLPWVQHATVMRLLPHQIRVAITERTPVAFVRQGSRIGLVDASGVLLDMPEDSAGDPHYSFPVLTGLSASDPLSTRAARMAIYQRFMQALDSAGEHLTKNLSEVDVSDPEDVKAVVTSDGSDVLVHFGDEDFLERYHEFAQHLPEWKQQYPRLASADMRYQRQVVLEMQPGTGVPVAGGNGAAANAPAANPPAILPTGKGAATAPAKHPVVAGNRVKGGRAKAVLTGGRTTASNAKVFAQLAAARRARLKAQQNRAAATAHATGSGAQ